MNIHLGTDGRMLLSAEARPEDKPRLYTPGGSGLSISSLDPADGATDASELDPYTITFSGEIQAGAGNIVIKQTLDDSTVQTIAISDPAVAMLDNMLTFAHMLLATGTGYYINIDSGAIQDANGIEWAGINDKTTWNFTTAG